MSTTMSMMPKYKVKYDDAMEALDVCKRRLVISDDAHVSMTRILARDDVDNKELRFKFNELNRNYSACKEQLTLSQNDLARAYASSAEEIAVLKRRVAQQNYQLQYAPNRVRDPTTTTTTTTPTPGTVAPIFTMHSDNRGPA
jgi:hypothetical protein